MGFKFSHRDGVSVPSSDIHVGNIKVAIHQYLFSVKVIGSEA